MLRKIILPTSLLTCAALLAGCSAVTAGGDATPGAAASVVQSSVDLSPDAVMADNADYTTVNTDEWEMDDAVDVALSGATTTIDAAGVYRLSGSYSGRVIVAAPKDAQVVLVLDGLQVVTDTGAAIEVQQADDVAIHLTAGTSNTVRASGQDTVDDAADAAIYAKSDLTFSGDGSLSVVSESGHGIKTSYDLVVLSGNIDVTAKEDAMRGKDALVVRGGDLTLSAEAGDGMHSQGDKADAESGQDDVDWSRGYVYIDGGTIDITAGDDGVQAFTDTVIAGGELTVLAADDGVKGEVIVAIGETEDTEAPRVTVSGSVEGIEAANIGISAGVIDVTASDDGVNASGNADLQSLLAGDMPEERGPAGAVPEGRGTEGPGGGMGPGGMPPGGGAGTGERLEISGGVLTIDAEGDGLDSNGDLTISGGTVTVYGPTRGGNGTFDSDGAFTVTGGTVIGLGPGSMEQTPDTEEQGWVLISATLEAGQTGTVTNTAGDTLMEFTSRKNATSLNYSASDVTTGETYSVVVDGEVVGSAEAGSESAMSGGPGMPGGSRGN